jgi:hypothetical protein
MIACKFSCISIRTNVLVFMNASVYVCMFTSMHAIHNTPHRHSDRQTCTDTGTDRHGKYALNGCFLLSGQINLLPYSCQTRFLGTCPFICVNICAFCVYARYLASLGFSRRVSFLVSAFECACVCVRVYVGAYYVCMYVCVYLGIYVCMYVCMYV